MQRMSLKPFLVCRKFTSWTVSYGQDTRMRCSHTRLTTCRPIQPLWRLTPTLIPVTDARAPAPSPRHPTSGNLSHRKGCVYKVVPNVHAQVTGETHAELSTQQNSTHVYEMESSLCTHMGEAVGTMVNWEKQGSEPYVLTCHSYLRKEKWEYLCLFALFVQRNPE